MAHGDVGMWGRHKRKRGWHRGAGVKAAPAEGGWHRGAGDKRNFILVSNAHVVWRRHSVEGT